MGDPSEKDVLWAPEHDWIQQFDSLLASKRVEKKGPVIAKPVVNTNLKRPEREDVPPPEKVVRPTRPFRRNRGQSIGS